MRRISVGVWAEDDIFWRGVSVCLNDDPALEVGSLADSPSDWDVVITPLAEAGRNHAAAVVAFDMGRGAAVVPSCPPAAILHRRSVTPDQLLGAVHAAAAGLRIAGADGSDDSFDSRSIQILTLLAEGASTSEISNFLAYSERTIKTLIHDLQEELGARNRAHAVAEAMRRNVI